MQSGCGSVSVSQEHIVSYSNNQSFTSHVEQIEQTKGFSSKSQTTMRIKTHFILYFVKAYQDKVLKLFKQDNACSFLLREVNCSECFKL